MKINDSEVAKEVAKEIIYKISHDMAAPLRQANSFSNLLVNTYGDDLNGEAKKWLEYIQSSTDKAQTMLTKLLEYSRLSEDTRTREPCDLNEIWSNVVSRHTTLIEIREAEISVSEELPIVTADKNHWMRIFMALLHNSLLYQEPDQAARIIIEARSLSAIEKEITFEDNGIGVEEKYYPVITDIFKRLHVDSEYPGVGVGLSFCEAIMKLYDGTIRFEKSELGGLKVILRFIQ